MKTFLDNAVTSLIEPGWRSGYRAGLEIPLVHIRANLDKKASGLFARRGSNPFPGALNEIKNQT